MMAKSDFEKSTGLKLKCKGLKALRNFQYTKKKKVRHQESQTHSNH